MSEREQGPTGGDGRKPLNLLPFPRRRLGWRVLPNTITMLALLCGFISLLRAGSGDYSGAAFLILIATILDGVDGKIARMTNGESAIGQQYDTLSDMVSFGVAPAFLLYNWAAPQLTGLAMVSACVYLVCAGFRLARFNIGGQELSGPFYRGLASPAAACLVGGLVWLSGGSWSPAELSPLVITAVCLLTLVSGILMISSVPYYKFSRLRTAVDQDETVLTLVFAGIVFGLLAYNTSLMMVLLAGSYTVIGPFRSLSLKLLRHTGLYPRAQARDRPSRSEHKPRSGP